MDTTLWNLEFGGSTSIPRCTYCLSVSHKSGKCKFLSDTHMSSIPSPYLTRKVVPGHPGLQSQHPICYAWNEDPTPGCPHHGCRFEHIHVCYLCSKDVRVQNKGQKSNPLPSSHLGQTNKATKACLLLLTNHPSISKRWSRSPQSSISIRVIPINRQQSTLWLVNLAAYCYTENFKSNNM